MSEFRDILNDLINKKLKVSIVPGVAKSIDKTEDICKVEPIDGPDLIDVKLRAVQDSSNASRFVVYPADGSNVLVGIINGDINNCVIIKESTFDEIKIEDGNGFLFNVKPNGDLDIKSNQIQFNTGSNGGIVKSASTTSELNTIISSLNALKTILTAWVPVSNDGGAALKTAVTAWASSSLTAVVQTNLENSSIKH